MKKIVAGTSVVALSLAMTSQMVSAANQDQAINLEVEVVDTLSMDCYDAAGVSGDTTVTLGDTTTGAGLVTAGVPSVGASTCDVTTNDDQGYFLTIEKTTETVSWADQVNGEGIGTGLSDAGTVLTHEDGNSDGTWYGIPDQTAYSYAATTPAGGTWSGTGLGFSVVNFPDTSLANNDFTSVWAEGTIGTDVCLDGSAVTAGGTDNALYAGVPDGAEAIAAVPEYNANTTTTNVCYKVDVDATQQSGQYAGQVTFTATSDAATYLN